MSNWVTAFIGLGVGAGVITIIYDCLLDRGTDE